MSPLLAPLGVLAFAAGFLGIYFLPPLWALGLLYLALILGALDAELNRVPPERAKGGRR
jgi:hypothetical protein